MPDAVPICVRAAERSMTGGVLLCEMWNCNVRGVVVDGWLLVGSSGPGLTVRLAKRTAVSRCDRG
jgi:hypothetical protein